MYYPTRLELESLIAVHVVKFRGVAITAMFCFSLEQLRYLVSLRCFCDAQLLRVVISLCDRQQRSVSTYSMTALIKCMNILSNISVVFIHGFVHFKTHAWFGYSTFLYISGVLLRIMVHVHVLFCGVQTISISVVCRHWLLRGCCATHTWCVWKRRMRCYSLPGESSNTCRLPTRWWRGSSCYLAPKVALWSLSYHSDTRWQLSL